MNETLTKLFINLSKRAEKMDRQVLIDSFVDVGPLGTVLSNIAFNVGISEAALDVPFCLVSPKSQLLGEARGGTILLDRHVLTSSDVFGGEMIHATPDHPIEDLPVALSTLA